MSSSSKKRSRSWKPSSFPYPVDYNDHFETPLQAYRDLQPLIDWIMTEPNNNKQNPVLYDPYYCDGQTAVLLQQLGYDKIVHQKRDFYLDIASDTVPAHDWLVTNPPYSDEHKIKCLDYAMQRLEHDNIPFALLLPTYVATKSYFRQAFTKYNLALDQTMVYLVPTAGDYMYHHPEGTGKDISPFSSMWFCGLPRDRHAVVREFWNKQQADNNNNRPKLYLSLAELEAAQVICAQNRPNPKQRRKKHRQQHQQAAARQQTSSVTEALETTTPKNKQTSTPTQSPRTKKKSKYRDESGQRKRRRF